MLVVPYTVGPASPLQIAEACDGRTDFVFLVHEQDAQATPLVPMLEELAPVVSHGGNASRVVEELAPLKPRGVVTFAEPTMRIAAAVAEAFGLPYNSQATCELLTSKLRQRERLNTAGVGRVRTFAFRLDDAESVSLPAGARYPAIIKPEEGVASRNTVFVASESDLPARLREIPPGRTYVFEEYIRGADIYGADWLADYVSVESAVAGGVIRHLGVSARLPLVAPFREGGLVFPMPPEEKTAASITDLAERAITATGITTGLVHTEIKMSPDGPQIIEVNGRLGGTMSRLIPRALGLDPVRLAVDIALGVPLPRDFGKPSRVAMLVYVQAPMEATAVEATPSAARLRALPGVFGVDFFARSGRPVDWRSGSLGRICDVWIDAESPEQLRERYRAVLDVLDSGIAWSRAKAPTRDEKPAE
ncbi:ATP-grasp domain-containing protein [Streptomyces sp. DSM 40750]|uniref:ATP-grasp domain-containing protein n=1 Tax=Streptomyces sp. DSM 40750 TaxID=2801030 RepID=UPI00214AAC65|nr:ATP-grasp domain-containing protein [Streptomyces sp. DSM 40750]UUU25949.1 ATP-grasp domain-containing protein [Streptomyces sp. DSM 40750]